MVRDCVSQYPRSKRRWSLQPGFGGMCAYISMIALVSNSG